MESLWGLWLFTKCELWGAVTAEGLAGPGRESEMMGTRGWIPQWQRQQRGVINKSGERKRLGMLLKQKAENTDFFFFPVDCAVLCKAVWRCIRSGWWDSAENCSCQEHDFSWDYTQHWKSCMDGTQSLVWHHLCQCRSRGFSVPVMVCLQLHAVGVISPPVIGKTPGCLCRICSQCHPHA